MREHPEISRNYWLDIGRNRKLQGARSAHTLPRLRTIRQRSATQAAARRCLPPKARTVHSENAFRAAAQDLRERGLLATLSLDNMGSDEGGAGACATGGAQHLSRAMLVAEYSVEASGAAILVPQRHQRSTHDEPGRPKAGNCSPARWCRCPASNCVRPAHSHRHECAAWLPTGNWTAAARPGLPHLASAWLATRCSGWWWRCRVLTVWMLLGTWRHMRRRAQIQTALVQETNFRRAMENSHAHRHARHGPGRPHHLRQRRLLRR
jgi:hypothetical protein